MYKARLAEKGSLEVIAYQDKSLTCRDCGSEFQFSGGEQEFYASKGLMNEPSRCPTCRATRKAERMSGGEREMHEVTCAECGGVARVPFLPRNDKPVYCSNCFDKVRARA